MQRADDIRAAFRRAKTICVRANAHKVKLPALPAIPSAKAPAAARGKYAALMNEQNPVSVLCSTKEENVQREPKSYAQVETSVKQQAVKQKSGGLKPEGGRAAFIGIRLSSQERQLVNGRAINSGLKLSAYARAALLGADYVAKHDPVRRKQLQDLSRELGHQGNNLNQIAKQLNSGFVTQDDAYALLNDLGGSLVSAHNAVRLAMTEGKVKP